MRSNARREVRTRSIGVISDSTVRIGLIFSVEPSHARAAPTRPPRRRNSIVSIANQTFRAARASRARGGGEHHQAEPPAGGGRVEDRYALRARLLLERRLGLQRALIGPGHPAGDVDR